MSANNKRGSRAKCHVRLSAAGVEIIAGGQWIAGITEREAKELMESLFRKAGRIQERIWKYQL